MLGRRSQTTQQGPGNLLLQMCAIRPESVTDDHTVQNILPELCRTPQTMGELTVLAGVALSTIYALLLAVLMFANGIPVT
jgi:hypothetical protein